MLCKLLEESVSLCCSITGRVMVKRNTLGAATTPRDLSHQDFSLQEQSVGKSVENRDCDGGRIEWGHH
jgi:hypothetical protein